jgi:hypothetical protein
MRIEWYEKDVYGKATRYLVKGEAQEAVQRLTGKKTVDESDLEALRSLGHEVVQVWGADRRVA